MRIGFINNKYVYNANNCEKKNQLIYDEFFAVFLKTFLNPYYLFHFVF